jgi:hypothetical protein
MQHLQKLLAPGGMVYLAIENRIGWGMFLGMEDHSGYGYTSLMPRWVARWYCSRKAIHRSDSNTGYRTYTYSWWGYRKLFRKSGLKIAKTWVPVDGYTRPTELLPLNRAAIRAYTETRWLRRPVTLRARLLNFGKRCLATKWFWKTFGGNFAFLLERRDA